MSLSTDSLVAGMRKALSNGATLPSLLSSPHFANLPAEQQREVIAALRSDLGQLNQSAVKEITKGLLGGALAGIPVATVIPTAVTLMAEGGLKNGGLRGAYDVMAGNKVLKALVGTSMAVSSGVGAVNSLLKLRAERKAHEELKAGLDSADTDEGLAANLFGAYGQGRRARQIRGEAVTGTLGAMVAPMVHESANLGSLLGRAGDKKPELHAALASLAAAKGYPLNVQKLDQAYDASANRNNLLARAVNIMQNNPDALGVDAEDVPELVEHYSNEANLAGNAANTLADLIETARTRS